MHVSAPALLALLLSTTTTTVTTAAADEPAAPPLQPPFSSMPRPSCVDLPAMVTRTTEDGTARRTAGIRCSYLSHVADASAGSATGATGFNVPVYLQQDARIAAEGFNITIVHAADAHPSDRLSIPLQPIGSQ
jgi:hypothetical protein